MCLNARSEYLMVQGLEIRRLDWDRHDSQHLVRSYLQSYVSHGGGISIGSLSVTWLICDYLRPLSDLIPDLLFNTSEPWLVDDLSSFHICLIGALAHENLVFCVRLKEVLARCFSPSSLGRVTYAENLFETTFGIASMDRHFRTSDLNYSYSFLSLLCGNGSVSIVKLFLEFGLDMKQGLRFAIEGENMDVVRMLLEAGANSHTAMYYIPGCNNRLNDAAFQQLLQLLVKNAKPTSIDPIHDPFLAIIESDRALRCYPEVLQHMLDRNLLSKRHLGVDVVTIDIRHSYMSAAILNDHPSVVDFLLRNGARATEQIAHSFECYNYWPGSCTWITFSVMCGAASCTEILIEHGADVTALDGNSMSTLQLAKKNVLQSHPRLQKGSYYKSFNRVATAEEDAETLAVVERAFEKKFMGTRTLEDYYSHPEQFAPPPPLQQPKSVSTLQEAFEKTLTVLLTQSQIKFVCLHLEDLYYDFRRIWRLSFHQALLMRFLYVVSYALLLAIELYALIRGHKRIPMPSRNHLSTLAVLALALIWGSSQMGISWGSYVAGTKNRVSSGDSGRD